MMKKICILLITCALFIGCSWNNVNDPDGSEEAPPSVKNVFIEHFITGGGPLYTVEVNEGLLNVHYEYEDANEDEEGSTRYQWMRNDEAISGETNRTYHLLESDREAFLSVNVTPVALTGEETEGATVSSHKLQVYGVLLDERTGSGQNPTEYPTIVIGEQKWMASNLHYLAPGSICYDHTNTNCGGSPLANGYENGRGNGYLYTWDRLMNINSADDATAEGVETIEGVATSNYCPDGWKLPSENDWRQLRSYVSENPIDENRVNLKGEEGEGIAVALKDRSVWIRDTTEVYQKTNEYGFSAKGSGWYFEGSASHSEGFNGEGAVSLWWTSDIVDSDTGRAVVLSNNNNNGDIGFVNRLKGFGLSVRCLEGETPQVRP